MGGVGVEWSSLALDEELLRVFAPVGKRAAGDGLLCGDAVEFARSLQLIALEMVDQGAEVTGADKWNRAHLLIVHLNQAGWERVISINADLTLLTLRARDFSNREHVFDVSIPNEYPCSVPKIQISLPAPVEVVWPRGTQGDLGVVFEAVERDLRRYEDLFVELEDIDTHCWVLDPLQPTFGSTHRRIAIDKTCSVMVELQVDNPRGLCSSIRLLGPPAKTQPMQNYLCQNSQLWSPLQLVRRNLELILGVTLPLRSHYSTNEPGKNEFLVECGICYSYALPMNIGSGMDGNEINVGISIPVQVCPHSLCGRAFHESCLSSWLQSVPSNRTSFGTIFGTCPYCGEFLSSFGGSC